MYYLLEVHYLNPGPGPELERSSPTKMTLDLYAFAEKDSQPVVIIIHCDPFIASDAVVEGNGRIDFLKCLNQNDRIDRVLESQKLVDLSHGCEG